jgi:transposase
MLFFGQRRGGFNYATHKHPKAREWLARHPRWTFHFTPTSTSWLNAGEGFFAKLTTRRLKARRAPFPRRPQECHRALR